MKHPAGKEFQSLAGRGNKLFVTSWNCDRKIMRPISITTGLPTRKKKLDQFSQFRLLSHRKDLKWLYFDDELRIQEKQQT